MILTVKGEANIKQRNYDNKANLADDLAILDYSNDMFIVLLSNCTDSFSPTVNNTHFLVEPFVILTHQV